MKLIYNGARFSLVEQILIVYAKHCKLGRGEGQINANLQVQLCDLEAILAFILRKSMRTTNFIGHVKFKVNIVENVD